MFRLDELGPLHNPEFTLVEWYRPGDGMDEGMQLTSDLCETMLGHISRDRGRAEATTGAAPVRRADQLPRGVRALRGHRSAHGRRRATGRDGPECGIEPPASLDPDDRDGWLDLLLVERMQPHLG